MITTYLSIALAALKIIYSFVSWARERELISEGYDKALAETAHAILLKTYAGKAIMEKVNAMSEAEVDAALHDLVPK